MPSIRKDHYPNLRKPTALRLSADDEGIGPSSRRARLISKALLRAQRRWDAYGLIVSLNSMPWEESKKTKEWRLIIQNGRLLRGIRKLSIYTPERGQAVDDEAIQRRRKVSVSYMQPPRRTRPQAQHFAGE